MSDMSTNALIIGSGLPSNANAELQEANKQWTEYYIHQAKVLKIISELPKPLQDAMTYTEAFGMAMESLFGGFNTLCETIENTHKIIEKFKGLENGPKLDFKDLKLSIDCDSLRSAVQKCLSKACFKICCECVCDSSRSSSRGSSRGASERESKIKSESSSSTENSGGSGERFKEFVADSIANHFVMDKVWDKLEGKTPKSRASGAGDRFKYSDGRQGYHFPEKSSGGRFSSLKSGFGKIGGLFSEGGSLGKLGELGGKGLGMLGKVGGLGLRALGPVGLLASGGMAAFDGYNKWNELKGKGADNWTALKGAAWAGVDSFTMGGASAVAGMIPQSWKKTAGNMLGGVDKAIGGFVNNPGKSLSSAGDWIKSKLPQFKWPNLSLNNIINVVKSKIMGILHLPNLTLGQVFNYVKAKILGLLHLPNLTLGQVFNYVKAKILGLLHLPNLTLGQVFNYVKTKILGLLHMPNLSFGQVFDYVKSKITGFLHLPSISFGDIQSWIMSKIGLGGPAGPSGPSSASFISSASGSGFRYRGYTGIGQSLGTTLSTMSGNCVDGTLAQLSLASSFGIPAEMVMTTWNGNPHVYGRINGIDRDVANHALTGSWSRPPAGPSTSSNFDEPRKIELHFHDKVYGMNDFDKQVEKSVNRLVPGGAF